MVEKKKIKARVIPEKKKKIVKELSELMQKSRTTMVASIVNLPSLQYQKIKKSLKGKAVIKFVKKNLVLMALEKSKTLDSLKNKVDKNFAILFSQLDPFELSSILAELKSKAKIKSGQLVEKEIIIEPGVTDLMAGPALTEFANAKIKVGVEQGKISIKEPVIIQAGTHISAELASILEKLELKPVIIGIKPLAALDSKENKFYENINIDKEETLRLSALAFQEAKNLALKIDYICKETIYMLLAKANMQALSLNSKINIQK
jgi:large subunit ribosomal protein L10